MSKPRLKYRIKKGTPLNCAQCGRLFPFTGRSHTYCGMRCYSIARTNQELFELGSRRALSLEYLYEHGLAVGRELASFLQVPENRLSSVLHRALRAGEVEWYLGLTEKGRGKIALLQRRQQAQAHKT